MLMNLSKVLGENHNPIKEEVTVESKLFAFDGDQYPLTAKTPLTLEIEYAGESKIKVKAKGDFEIIAACDRCLEDTPIFMTVEADKLIDVTAPEEDEIIKKDGYCLDVEMLVRNELFIGWPTKIVCKEDCQGLCGTCGQNLNVGECDCEDTGLDPRMSVIRDLFKEV